MKRKKKKKCKIEEIISARKENKRKDNFYLNIYLKMYIYHISIPLNILKYKFFIVQTGVTSGVFSF